jgi:DinB superfamily
MKDAEFIKDIVFKGTEAGERVKKEFSNLTLLQLNWKPAPDSWSVGQCLDHLIISDCSYFPVLKKITNNKFTMTAWQKWSPFSGLFGKILADQMQEKVKGKLLKAPKLFTPSYSQIDAGIIERFQKHLDTLLEYIAALKDTDLDKVRITSPVAKFVTYSLRNTIKILVPHLHRHINQAIRLKQKEDFPK